MIGNMTLSLLAQELGGELLGEDVIFSSVSTDTRLLQSGDLYLALVGENFDGNNFIDDSTQIRFRRFAHQQTLKANHETLQRNMGAKDSNGRNSKTDQPSLNV